MKICVFGGSGRTGKLLIAQALEQDFEVTGLLRNPGKLDLRHAKLNIIRGDVFDPEAVSTAIQGCHAVLSALGASSLGKTDLYSKSMKNIVSGMEANSVKRLLCIAAVGIERDPGIPLLGRLIMGLVLGNILADMQRMQQEIESSYLEWTILWPPMLTNGQMSGKYRIEIGRAVPKGSRISRADLAHFMVRNIDNAAYFKKKVAIAY
jgi:putative NADH-flavin reductase